MKRWVEIIGDVIVTMLMMISVITISSLIQDNWMLAVISLLLGVIITFLTIILREHQHYKKINEKLGDTTEKGSLSSQLGNTKTHGDITSQLGNTKAYGDITSQLGNTKESITSQLGNTKEFIASTKASILERLGSGEGGSISYILNEIRHRQIEEEKRKQAFHLQEQQLISNVEALLTQYTNMKNRLLQLENEIMELRNENQQLQIENNQLKDILSSYQEERENDWEMDR